MTDRIKRTNLIIILTVITVITVLFGVGLVVQPTANIASQQEGTIARVADADTAILSGVGGDVRGFVGVEIAEIDLNTLVLTALDDEAVTYVIDTITVTDLPAGVAYDNTTKLIAGTPTTAVESTATIVAEGETYIGTLAITFSIKDPAIKADNVVIEKAEVPFNGAEQLPQITVTDNEGLALTSGVGYTLTFMRSGVVTTDFTSIGVIDVTASMLPPYSGSVALTYTIKESTLVLSQLPGGIDAIYNRNMDDFGLSGIVVHKEGVRQTVDKITLVNPADLPQGIVFDADKLKLHGRPTEVATKPTVKFIIKTTANDYKEFSIYINVARQLLHGTQVHVSYQSTVYSGTEKKPIITVKDNVDNILTLDTDYKLTFIRDNAPTSDLTSVTSSAGMEIKIEGIGNFGGTTFKKYYINAKAMNDSNLRDMPDVNYNGSIQMPTIVFENYSADEHDVLIYRNGKVCTDFVNAGRIEVRVTFKGNYVGVAVKSYDILPVVADPKDISISADVTYNGSNQPPTVTVANWQLGRDYNVKLCRGEVETTDFTSAGRIDVVITFINNNSGEYAYRYNILAKDVNNIQLNLGEDVVYTGSDIVPTVNVNSLYHRGIDYDILYQRSGTTTTDLKSVGVVTVRVVMKGNYSGEQSMDYTILYSLMSMVGGDALSAKISSSKGFLLNTSFSMSVRETPTIHLRLNAGEVVKMVINIKMLEGEKVTDLNGKATVRIKPGFDAGLAESLRIEYVEKDTQTSRRCVVDAAGYITFDIYSVGEISIIAQEVPDKAMPWWTWVAVGGGVVALLLVIVVLIALSYKNNGVRTIMPKKRR